MVLDRQGARRGAAWGLLLAMPLLACGASSRVAEGTGGQPVGAGSGGAHGGGGHPGGGATASGGTTGTGGVPGGSGGSSGSGGTAVTGAGGALGSGGAGQGGKMGGSGGQGGASHQGGGGTGATALGGSKGPGGSTGAGGTATGGSGPGTGGMGTGGAATGGSGPGTGGAGGGSASTAMLLVDLGSAFCTAARTCCTAANLPSTLDDCETKFQSRLSGLANVTAGSETIDNTALSACIAGYRATASTCAFQPLDAACKGVFVGTKAEGAKCGKGGTPWTSAQGECQITGRVTECVWTGDVNVSTTTGVCHTAERGKAGDPCAVSCAKNEICTYDLVTSPGAATAACLEDDGLYCASSGTQSVCAPIVATGASCADDPSACATTDYCDSTSSAPRCRTAATLGQSCASTECASNMSLDCGSDQKCMDLGFAFDLTCGGTPPFPL